MNTQVRILKPIMFEFINYTVRKKKNENEINHFP